MDIFSVSKSAWTSSQFLRVHGHLLNFWGCMDIFSISTGVRGDICRQLCCRLKSGIRSAAISAEYVTLADHVVTGSGLSHTLPYITLAQSPRNVALAVLLSVLAGSVIHLYVKKWLCCFSVNNTISLSQWSVSYPLPTLYEKEVAQKLHGVMFHSREEGNVSAPYPLSQWSVS